MSEPIPPRSPNQSILLTGISSSSPEEISSKTDSLNFYQMVTLLANTVSLSSSSTPPSMNEMIEEDQETRSKVLIKEKKEKKDGSFALPTNSQRCYIPPLHCPDSKLLLPNDLPNGFFPCKSPVMPVVYTTAPDSAGTHKWIIATYPATSLLGSPPKHHQPKIFNFSVDLAEHDGFRAVQQQVPASDAP